MKTLRSDIELLRLISAFGIVWFHSDLPMAREFSYSGLIFFLVLSAFLATKSRRHYQIGDRAGRLLIPYAIWSIFYAVVHFYMAGDPSIYFHDLKNQFFTTSAHLWYLPYIFACSIGIDKAKRACSNERAAILATVLACMLLLTSPIWREWEYAFPLGQYMHSFPAICIGFVLANLSFKGICKKLSLVLFGLVFLSVSWVFLLGLPGMGTCYFVGFLMSTILLADNINVLGSQLICKLSRLAFGIYLSHPFFILVFCYMSVGGVLLPVASFTASALTTYAVRKIFPENKLKYIS